MRLPFVLRLFWAVFLVAVIAVVALPFAPALEATWFPVREHARIEHVGRGSAYLWFDWSGEKRRMLASPGVDVSMRAAGDVFDLTLYNDESRPGESRCTRVMPWATSRMIGLGEHRQKFCIEIPPSVGPTDSIEVDVTPRYRGLFGLWEIRAPFPHIREPSLVDATPPR